MGNLSIQQILIRTVHQHLDDDLFSRSMTPPPAIAIALVALADQTFDEIGAGADLERPVIRSEHTIGQELAFRQVGNLAFIQEALGFLNKHFESVTLNAELLRILQKYLALTTRIAELVATKVHDSQKAIQRNPRLSTCIHQGMMDIPYPALNRRIIVRDKRSRKGCHIFPYTCIGQRSGHPVQPT